MPPKEPPHRCWMCGNLVERNEKGLRFCPQCNPTMGIDMDALTSEIEPREEWGNGHIVDPNGVDYCGCWGLCHCGGSRHCFACDEIVNYDWTCSKDNEE